MVSAETVIVNLLGAASYAGGAYLAVKYVLPLVQGLLSEVVKYRTTVSSFMKLLTFAVYLTAATGIVNKISSIGDKTLSQITLVNPALEVLDGLFFPTIKLLVIGVGILLVAERVKLR
ncbi:hypothetical protein CMO88_00590 [Candidatus Woesearchaeota archaeon]|nr:hypothetical protein [Candidatus Woesearchaeota archaeon]|tara:strand:+ start:14654 stop:15007 length:354 start_codon:yes stop_codon:yes gene_type:complete